MPIVHVTLDNGELVDSFNLEEIDPTKHIAKFATLSEIWDAIILAFEKEKDESTPDKNIN